MSKCPGCLTLRSSRLQDGRYYYRCLNTFCPYYKQDKLA